MKKTIATPFTIAVSAAPLLYLAAVWESLPTTIVTSYNWSGQVNRTGPKEELWIVGGLLAALSIGLYFLLANLHRLNPKAMVKEPQPVFTVLGLGIAAFLSITSALFVASCSHPHLLQKAMLPLTGLLVVFLGACMAHLQPNHLAGFRVVWTLSDEHNWRKTHIAASRLWMVAGALLTAGALLLPSLSVPIAVLICLFVTCLVPVIYSYSIFKRSSHSH